MKFNLFPEDPKFYTLFQQQAELIVEICRRFQALASDLQDAETKYAGIDEVENQGDTLFHELTARLARTFVTPIDREDIHLIGSRMDDILDLVQKCTQRMRWFGVESTRPALAEMAEIMVSCADVLQQGIKRLPTFTDIADLRSKMHQFESRGDDVSRQAVADLFKGCEVVGDVVNLIKWKEILENVEDAVDRFEDVFDVVEGVIIKHA
ncbi:MAG: hypothetical protein AMXMBFR33_36790 [Candidatus Xenobia bacterium]